MLLIRLAGGLFAGVLALAAFQAAPAPGQSKDPKPASIEGKVIHAVSGGVLKKTTVLLVRSGSGAGATLTAETGDKGEFAFKDLQPGRYQLIAERAGFARQAYGARRRSLQGTTLQISA